MTTGARIYFLTTERLGFRRWSEYDLSLALALWGDVAVTNMIGGPFSRDIVKARLDSEISSIRTVGVQYWPVFMLDGGDFVGCAGLRPYRAVNRAYELGIHLRPAFWGQGVAVEACQAVINIGFETVGATALFAGHHPENARTKSLLSRLGFRYTHDEHYSPTDLMHPSYWLLPDER